MGPTYTTIVAVILLGVLQRAQSQAVTVTLNNVVRATSGIIMKVSLTPTYVTPSTGKFVVTLSGSGLACSGCGVAFSSPAGASASAAVFSGTVMTVTLTAGTFNANALIVFTVSGVTNPTAAQVARTNVASAVTSSSGVIQGQSAAGTYPAIVDGSLTGPAITLSDVRAGGAAVQMTIVFAPAVAVPSTGKLISTLTGSPALASPSLTATSGALLSAPSLTSNVLTLTFTANSIAGGLGISITVSGFVNPAATQEAYSDVAAAVTNSFGVIQSRATNRTFPAIVDGSMGTSAPTIALSSVIRGATGVVMTVTLQPATAVPSTGKFVVTLSGSGLACSGCGVAFSSPAGASASAAVFSGTVMTVTLTAGTFNANALIVFTVSGVTNPTAAQVARTNVASAVTSSSGVIQGQSAAGTFPAIFSAQVSNPSVHLSSYIQDAAAVTATISFFVASLSVSFSSVSVTGLPLGSNSVIGVECFNMNPSSSVPSAALVASSQGYTLTLTFSAPITAFSSIVAFSCNVYGLRNVALPFNYKTLLGAQISTWTDLSAPVDTSTKFGFPAIFQKSASNSVVDMRSYIRGVTGNVATISFSLSRNSLNTVPSFKIISLTGLSFSSYSQTSLAPVFSINDTVVPGITVSASYTAGSLTLVSTADSFFPSSDYESLAAINVTCVVSGFTNSAVQASGSSIALSTWSNIPVDVQTGILSRAIVSPLTQGAVHLSTYVRSRAVVATLSFVVATPLQSIKSISVSGVSFSAFDLSIAAISCSNVGSVGTISALLLPGSLVLFFTISSIVVNASVPLQCQIGGLTHSNKVLSAVATVNIWTLSSNGQPIDMQSDIVFPAVFSSDATSPAITLSSYIRNSAGVSMGVSFIAGSPLQSIRTVSITGVAFAGHVSFGSVVCTNVGTLTGITAEFDSTTDVVSLRFSSPVIVVFSAFAVSCTLPGFTNVPSARHSVANVVITTFDAADAPTDVAIAVAFPAIFSGSFTNPALTLSSQIIGMSSTAFSFSVSCGSIGEPVGVITVQGVSFPSSSSPLIVTCSVGPQSSPTSAAAIMSSDSQLSILSISFMPFPISIPSPGNMSCTVMSLSNPSAVTPARRIVTLSRFQLQLKLFNYFMCP